MISASDRSLRIALFLLIVITAIGAMYWLDCGAEPVHANPRPLPPEETTADARVWLARAMVAEAGWTSEADHAAIAWVLARRWRREAGRYPDLRFTRMVELYCAAWDGKPTARQRWVRELDGTLRRPESFPASLSWERHRKAWAAVLDRSGAFLRGELADPCDGRAVHFGGDMDVPPPHFERVDCGGTANTFYALR